MRRIPQTGSEEDTEQLRGIAFSRNNALLVRIYSYDSLLNFSLRKKDIPKLDHLGVNGRANRRRP
jgi:hypothetical protein